MPALIGASLSYDRKGDVQDEAGKFICMNTPYKSYLDKKVFSSLWWKNNGTSTTGIIAGDESEILSQNKLFNGLLKLKH